MIPLFWLLISLTLYCYFAYPLLLWMTAKLRPNPVLKGICEPSVSVVLSVWNEEDVMERKIKNLLTLDYPKEKMEIWIGSDGSTDRTDEILSNIRDPRVHVVINEQRQGKMATINTLVEARRAVPLGGNINDILVFCDARQTFAPDAVKELVGNFADPHVGCVSGELIFQKEKKAGATAQGLNLYWNYEKLLREMESQIHSMLGATGAVYAIRRDLFEPIPSHIVLDDMFVPLKIIQKGSRAVWDETAKAYDEIADSPREEHRRKVRTLFGNYQIFGLFPDLFNPLKSPVAIQLVSHKFLRVLVPFFMIAVFILNWMICRGHGAPCPYQILFGAQILFYAMAILGALSRHQKYGILALIAKVCYIPYVFCLLNFSALAGFFQIISGGQDVKWKKARK